MAELIEVALRLLILFLIVAPRARGDFAEEWDDVGLASGFRTVHRMLIFRAGYGCSGREVLPPKEIRQEGG